ncbi:hypothetical protein BU23DRAFT_136896 [Bimuria novae-zelandiae CBS 107.79]|uniref:Uncharacterized protein n=1 Tax=Bimuria novae-zelandiae CBS 107.79 TaxID=1447943 RepID=A0A6A5VEC6_9PLEO|nr:hypothetical protein BU23DRAFT_136896 [Bimuria novae-zelandiae CBS 107.79]
MRCFIFSFNLHCNLINKHPCRTCSCRKLTIFLRTDNTESKCDNHMDNRANPLQISSGTPFVGADRTSVAVVAAASSTIDPSTFQGKDHRHTLNSIRGIQSSRLRLPRHKGRDYRNYKPLLSNVIEVPVVSTTDGWPAETPRSDNVREWLSTWVLYRLSCNNL